jgi:hypothetical protein
MREQETQEAMEAVAEFINSKGERIFFIRNLISSIIGAFILFLMGLFFLFFFAAETRMHCERTEANMINCTHSQSWFGIYEREKEPITGLQGAWIEERYDSDDNDTTYRVVLETQQGNVPLTNAFSSGYSAKAETMQQVNAFVQNSTENSAEISTGTPVVMMLIGAALLVFSPFQLIISIIRKGRPLGRQKNINFSELVKREKQERQDKDFWD